MTCNIIGIIILRVFSISDIYSLESFSRARTLLGKWFLEVVNRFLEITIRTTFVHVSRNRQQVRPCLDVIFLKFDTIAFLFVFDKHFLIIDWLGSKDSFRDLQVNCAISYFLSIFNVSFMCPKIRWDGWMGKFLVGN